MLSPRPRWACLRPQAAPLRYVGGGRAGPRAVTLPGDPAVPPRTKIEKEKKEHARLHGMIRTEISGAEIAEEMEKERRLFQLQMCEVRGDPATPSPGVWLAGPPAGSGLRARARLGLVRRGGTVTEGLQSRFSPSLWDRPVPVAFCFEPGACGALSQSRILG